MWINQLVLLVILTILSKCPISIRNDGRKLSQSYHDYDHNCDNFGSDGVAEKFSVRRSHCWHILHFLPFDQNFPRYNLLSILIDITFLDIVIIFSLYLQSWNWKDLINFEMHPNSAARWIFLSSAPSFSRHSIMLHCHHHHHHQNQHKGTITITMGITNTITIHHTATDSLSFTLFPCIPSHKDLQPLRPTFNIETKVLVVTKILVDANTRKLMLGWISTWNFISNIF